MADIFYLTHIRFEEGALTGIPGDLIALGVSHPLIVTDKGVKDAGLLDRLISSLGRTAKNRVAVFDQCPSNPTEAAVYEALEHYKAQSCDGIIALGGGSPIDLAKAVALLTTHEGPLRQYAAILGGVEKIASKVAPVIAVPTTAGTGSEVGRAALITLEDSQKLGFISPFLIPRRAVCDPTLTVGMPAALTAATGLDALSHCVETYLSPRINPPAEAIAIDGARRIWRNLERVVRDGSDVRGRWEMMMGSLEGGMTFQKGLGAVHGLSHALGGIPGFHLHHGVLNAIFLPKVVAFNADHVGHKMTVLSEVFDCSPGELPSVLANLNERIGLPNSLTHLNIPTDLDAEIAKRAMADHSTATSPRPMTEELYAELLRSSR